MFAIQAPITNIAFSFSHSFNMQDQVFTSEEICELLEHESTSEFSNFTRSENSVDKVNKLLI